MHWKIPCPHILFVVALYYAKSQQWFPMPNGKNYHIDCIHQYEEKHQIYLDEMQNETRVQFANGTVITHSPCPHIPSNIHPASYQVFKKPEYYSDWAAYAQTTHLEGYGQMISKWTVPVPPTSQGPLPPLISSSIYLFNGLEDGSGHAGSASVILQPVLQYGKSGCLVDPRKFKDWYFTAYLVTEAGRAYCGPNIGPLHPGEILQGNMTKVNTLNNTWQVQAKRLSTQEVSKETVNLGTTRTIDAAYLTLEAMIIYGCDAYPHSGNVTFDHNVLKDQDINPIIPKWEKKIRHSECDQNVQIGQSAEPITITWDPTK